MLNLILPVNRVYTVVTRAGLTGPEGFVRSAMGRLILNLSSANLLLTIIKAGPYWNGNVALNILKMAQEKVHSLLKNTSFG